MNDRNALMSLLTDRKINSKIALGFACVPGILVVNSGMAYVAFRSSAEGFASYTQRVTVTGIARDLDRSFLNLRRFVREYALTGSEPNIAAAKQEQVTLLALLQRGLHEIENPERHRRLEEISRLTGTYLDDFAKMAAATRQQNQLMDTTLAPPGLAQRRNFQALMAAGGTAAAGSDTSGGDLTAFATNGLDQFMLARLNVTKVILQHDPAAAAEAEKLFTDLGTTLQGLDAATKGAASRQSFEDLRAGLAAYREAFGRVTALNAESTGIINGSMRAIADQVQANGDAITASGEAEEKQQEQTTLSAMDHAGTLVLGLAIGGLLLGAVFSWLIGCGIARPVVRLSDAMRALAAGDNATVVPGVERGDEIGAMAKTVAVFKQNALEMDRLRADQEARKRASAVERKAALRRLADAFEGQVGSVIQAVSTATSQLQTASKQMTDNAARTSAEATSVSSASAESAANAQAVATEAEHHQTQG